MSDVRYRGAGDKEKRSCQFLVQLNNCNNKNLNCEMKMNPGDFFSQLFWMLLLLFPISSSVVRLSAYSKDANTRAHKRNMAGQHTCTQEKHVRPTHRSSQVGERGLYWDPHQTNSTHINVNKKRPMLFSLSDWSGLKFAGWCIHTPSL